VPCLDGEGEQHAGSLADCVDEETRLLNAAAPWLRELMLFAIHSGMRMGEILDLTWAGVSVLR